MSPYFIDKQVNARPMLFGDFVEYIAASPKEGFSLEMDSPGYVVENPEAYPNTNNHSGGLRWIPKSEFEFTHVSLEEHAHLRPHEIRVMVEYTQLMTRLKALKKWTKDDSFLALHTADRQLLLEQCAIMTRLSFILEDRITRMTTKHINPLKVKS